jgi:telomere length regulation protein
MKDLLVDPTLLSSIIKTAEGNNMELNQVKSLFFGSKIFNSFEGRLDLERYLVLLAKQLVEVCKVGKSNGDYFIGILSLHPIESKIKLFAEFLTDSKFFLLVSAVNDMNKSQKQKFFIKHFLPYLESFVNIRNLDTTIRILEKFNFEDVESHIVKYLGDISNVSLQQSVTYHLQSKKLHFESLMQLWGDDQYIKDVQDTHQERLTTQLLILSNYLSKTELNDISKTRLFLNAITSRLSINDPVKRNLGITIARVVTNNEVQLVVEDEIIVDEIPKVNFKLPIDFSDLLLVNAINDLSISNRKQTVTIDSDDDSDNEDGYESQDETEPVFLKDLVVKFNSDKLNSITKLLSHTIRLVRQKATFKLEIEFYSEELITLLVGLVNKYEEANFEKLKLNAIVSVIVVNPLIISHIMRLLFTGDYSLQQRMIILSSISLSAREMRGFEDDFIENPTFDFPTKQIESRKKTLVEEVQAPKLQEIKDDENEGVIGQGKVTRVSSKLTKSTKAVKANNFSKIAPKFFYPLANGWIEGINVGHYSEMFLKHYLQTMELIINAAYPCHDFENMAELFAEIQSNTSNVIVPTV